MAADRRPKRHRLAPSRRIALLPLLQLLLPGLGQYVRGHRLIGSVAMGASVLFWLAVLAAVVLAFTDRLTLIGLLTSERSLAILTAAGVALGLLWLGLGVDLTRAAVWEAPTRRHWTVALLVAVVTTAQAGTAGWAASTANSQRMLVGSLFDSPPAAAAPAEPSTDEPRLPEANAPEEPASRPPPAPAPDPPVAGRYNILLLGGDAGPTRIGLRTDSISVASIDAVTGEITIIGIPRNLQNAPFAEGSPLWKHFPHGYDCGNECLISYLYTHGSEYPALYSGPEHAGRDPGVEATRDAVEGVLGITVPYSVLIDIQSFVDLVDALGGITVDVPQRTVVGTNGRSPDFVIEAGPQQMNGRTAMWYARTRYETTDFTRMRRQREVQLALLEQANPVTVFANFQRLARAGRDYVATDIPQPLVATLLDLALKAKEQPVTTLELAPPEVNTENPDFAAIRERVAEALR